ncbi:hypothetical protein [Bermanella sp. R86510]|uniref:hypothetical protein n=1 Tax=unclassified Bermanella TaxID=2627862 RepID=UPI0037CC8AA9
MSQEKKMGRPKRPDIDKIRTKIWFDRVRAISRKSAYALEKEFSKGQFKHSHNETYRPTQWYKYKSGQVSPSDRRLNEVEGHYPGTRVVFDQLVWVLLGTEYPEDILLKEGIGAANARLIQYIGKTSKHFPGRIYPLTSDRSLRSLSNIDRKELLYRRTSPLTNFTAMLCVMIDAEKKNCQIQYVMAKFYLKRMIPDIMHTYYLQYREEFIDILSSRFFDSEALVFKLEMLHELRENRYD